MKPTIRDVAKYAGVSVATVSRYLNNSPLIAPASVEKVKDAIEVLNYQPSMMARGLLHGNSGIIALAVDDSNVETYGNDYFLRIQYGLEHELAHNGYYLMICHIGNGDVEKLETIINENRADGLVLLSELAKQPVLELLQKSELPFIIAGRSSIFDVSWVDIDNIEAGRCATRRLLQSGAKRIGFLTNSLQKVFALERYNGYCTCLEESGLEINQNYLAEGLVTPEIIGAYVDSCGENLCDAYVASDSLIAFYFLRELNKRKIAIPENVQVIGFDDSILAEVSEPAITVVKIDVMNLGKAAAKMLVQQLRSEQRKTEQLLLPVEIIERRTTKK